MPFQKGRAKTGGRPPGQTNKATAECRAVIALIADEMAPEFRQWLQRTADGDKELGIKADPGKAADLYLKAIEYHIPKLGRTEHVGDGGGPVQVAWPLPKTELDK